MNIFFCFFCVKAKEKFNKTQVVIISEEVNKQNTNAFFLSQLVNPCDIKTIKTHNFTP